MLLSPCRVESASEGKGVAQWIRVTGAEGERQTESSCQYTHLLTASCVRYTFAVPQRVPTARKAQAKQADKQARTDDLVDRERSSGARLRAHA